MLAFYRRDARSAFAGQRAVRPADPARRLWEILWPVEGGRVLARPAHRREHAGARLPCGISGERRRAQRSTGAVRGAQGHGSAAAHLSLWAAGEPFGAADAGDHAGPYSGPDQTSQCAFEPDAAAHRLFFCIGGDAVLVWGRPLAQLLYRSAEAGFYLETLAPAMPLMYLESMVDGAMKGVGEQKAAFRYSVWDSILRIGGVVVLLPRFGMKGFLAVILLSSLYTCIANTGRLLFSSGTRHAFRRWLGAPALAALLAAGAGAFLKGLLADGLRSELPMQLAALGAGGCMTAAAFLLAAWPLGLGEEVKALRTKSRQPAAGRTRAG